MQTVSHLALEITLNPKSRLLLADTFSLNPQVLLSERPLLILGADAHRLFCFAIW